MAWPLCCASDMQLFAERCALVCNWFDAWNEEERCSFTFANVPPERADFSTLLPRALSLRILGFLSPRDLSRAAQVCWRWRFLAEQDVIWAPKCVNQGWFLPYSPCETEFGAWKRHYIQCVTSLDWTHPPQDQTQNRENPQRVKSAASAKQRARATRRWLKRQSTTWKSECMSGVPCGGLSFWFVYLIYFLCLRSLNSSALPFSLLCDSGQWYPVSLERQNSSVPPPIQLLLAAVKTRVKSLLYDYRVDSLDCLLRRVEATLGNQEASGIAVITDGDAGEIRLLSCKETHAKNLQVPEVRDFWERLSGCLCLGEDGGHLDIFHPLKSSGKSHKAENNQIYETTHHGILLLLHIPLDDCEWSWTPPDGSDVPSLYFSRDHLITWGRVSDSMAEATKASRQHLQPFLAQLGRENSATTSQAGPQQHAVGHEVMAAEIMRRETVYMRTLESLKEVYASPLKAALASGRPIISATNVQVIVSDPLHILDLHRLVVLMKMVEGGPEHSLGEVFSRFMKKLSVYTSFFNNYSHVLQTIEEVQFISVCLHIMHKWARNLPELLLEVARRLPCLLYELRSLHLSTSFDNSDRVQIAAAADSFFLNHPGCGNLYYTMCFTRIYEHFQDLGLFLFNDALVFTTCSVTHSPFERSRKTRHHFYVSVSLACLHLDDISDSKYVCNAFRLCGTRQEWTCAVDTSEEKLTWLAALNAAIRSANWT
uniref:Coiled-coil domain containing 28A n=1 Tax=Eptatretus burgeri TaxID=7764 RepID=A0A8C4R708_EPTBU